MSISLDGAAPFEDMLVWWLQAPSKHADLRVPLSDGGEAIAFAGTTTWQAPALTWVPDLQRVPNDFPDTGDVTWDGEDLLEAGTSVGIDGTPIGYVERWRRLPESVGPQLALSRPGGRIVRTGDLALSVVDTRSGDAGGHFSAVAYRLGVGGWAVDHSIPGSAAVPPAPSPPPPALELTAGASVVLGDGLLWTVDEAERMAVSHG